MSVCESGCSLTQLQTKVAFDVAHERQSNAGVTRYSRELRRALHARHDVEIIPLGEGAPLRRGSLVKKLITAQQDLWWYPGAGRRAAHKSGAQIYHCPSPRAPLTGGLPPTVVTIHDLASFRYPETLTRWTRLYERATLRRVAHAADRIITPSADTASDVEQILEVSSEKIRIIPLAVDDLFFRQPRKSEMPYAPYVLFVGTPQPRKNLRRLSSAVEQLRHDGANLQLVVAGADGWGDARLGGDHIRFVGRVDDETLLSLYRSAACLALVSLHEGFGLPALEAMAAGAPVVVSSAGALPEVVGDAGILVDPLSVDSIAAGIGEALRTRSMLVQRGKERAGDYTWAKTSERTVEVYRELL